MHYTDKQPKVNTLLCLIREQVSNNTDSTHITSIGEKKSEIFQNSKDNLFVRGLELKCKHSHNVT